MSNIYGTENAQKSTVHLSIFCNRNRKKNQGREQQLQACATDDRIISLRRNVSEIGDLLDKTTAQYSKAGIIFYHKFCRSNCRNELRLQNEKTEWHKTVLEELETEATFSSSFRPEICPDDIIRIYIRILNITNTAVVIETMKQSQQVASECDESYMEVTYDLAIAKTALEIQSMEKPRFNNLFIHFETFQFMMAYFKAASNAQQN
ncbi:hypothetical protein WA026_020549 [Henosepilachna vigintioctopunctata]|uniref:Uncharacterized protein n=1 Tax=Henosepilachna vigintioctopunctata TaxID=420089 RepID=A0AAW1VI15_9CUCU